MSINKALQFVFATMFRAEDMMQDKKLQSNSAEDPLGIWSFESDRYRLAGRTFLAEVVLWGCPSAFEIFKNDVTSVYHFEPISGESTKVINDVIYLALMFGDSQEAT